MKRLLVMLLILCAFAGLFACASTQEETAPATTTTPSTTTDGPQFPSVSLVPGDSTPAIQPALPSGTLPQLPVPTERPPDATIPAPPPTTRPNPEYS